MMAERAAGGLGAAQGIAGFIEREALEGAAELVEQAVVRIAKFLAQEVD
jgi:hypothetical protein